MKLSTLWELYKLSRYFKGKNMGKLRTFFEGYKSYIVAGIAALIYFLNASGIYPIPKDMEEQIYKVLEILFGVTMAAKINRMSK